MTLIVDSREQASLKDEFKEGVFDEILVDGLPLGDYALKLDDKEVPMWF